MDYNEINADGVAHSQTAGRVNFSNTIFKNEFSIKEAYKALRTNILFSGKETKVIAITSTVEDEGKSTISIELAKSISDIGKKVLFIDADMRKSALLKRNMKTRNVLGLSELLSEQVTVNQVLYNTQLANFDVIFTGNFPPNPVELLSSPKLEELLKKFREEYDYVIIDTPPLDPVIDAAVIAPKCDGVALVIALGMARYEQIARAKDQLVKSGAKILGAIVNETKANARDMKSYKNYGYYAED